MFGGFKPYESFYNLIISRFANETINFCIGKFLPIFNP